jgi:hypothetical protein
MAVLNNVVFFYTKIQSPVPAFVKTNSEFVVDCVVDKATAKAYSKQFQKQKAKELDNEEFKEKYKVEEVPFPKQDEQYIIKLKKNHIKDGKQTPDKYRPRVLQATEDGNVDITFEKLVGNGSKGRASYRVTENDFGTFAELQAILVEDLVEYGGGSVTSDFGDVKLKDVPASQKVVNKQGEADEAEEEEKPVKAAPKKPNKAKAPVEDEDDDIPF